MKTLFKTTIFMLTASLMMASAAHAGSKENKAVAACKDAIIEAQGSDQLSADLKKIKPRGRAYEVWFNVSEADVELKSYCKIRRGEIEALVTEEGRWEGSNPRRPEV